MKTLVTRRQVVFLFVCFVAFITILSVLPAGAQTAPKLPAAVSTGGIAQMPACPVPQAPVIEVTTMDDLGTSINSYLILYRETQEGQLEYVGQTNCSPDNGAEPQGCGVNGRARFTIDLAGNKLTVGDYTVYGQVSGYDGAFNRVHAESGVAQVNIILRSQSVTVSVQDTVARQGITSYVPVVTGNVPSGVEIYTIPIVTGPSGQQVMWEANRKSLNLSGGGYGNATALPKQTFFAEGAPTGFWICAIIYFAQ